MKKIHLLALKAFIRPFFVTFFIVMFILLMLFLFKYIDDLIGKGFEWYIILKLMGYASATYIPMALPLAMLLSSIMAFGNLAENYELVAIKAAGISLQRAMKPLFIVVGLVSVGAFAFSEYMLPVANLKMGSLLYDLRNQRSASLIQEGVFSNNIPGYSIRVGKKDKDGSTLHDILIYEQNPNGGGIENILMAKQGYMYRTADGQFLVLKLKDGVRYEESADAHSGTFNPRQKFIREKFQQTEQKFDLSAFKLVRTDERLFKSNYAMLNLRQLWYYKDSVEAKADSMRKANFAFMKINYRLFRHPLNPSIKPKRLDIKKYHSSALALIPNADRMHALAAAQAQLQALSTTLAALTSTHQDFQQQIRRFIIEYNRKFTLSISCIILFAIGAPLGAIVRKGGIGMSVVLAMICFLFYHIISTIGEKLAKDGDIEPIIGTWIALLALAPVAAFLTYIATMDSALLNIEFYITLWKRLLNIKPREKPSIDKPS